ncbi:MAG: hypothetical protein IJW13_06135 [Clostridia bacterium]|nr:hypothetical protein [Clostridia bacterium]
MNTVKFEKGKVRVVAHRGLSGIEKENTNTAFVAAGNRSYYGIETDVHRTADGKFVICHDSELTRVSGEKILVEQVSLDLLESIRLFDTDNTKDRADIRPTSLENYIKICKRYEKHCVLELKSDFTDDETARFIDIIKSYDYLENVTFISFIYENLQKVRAILPNQSVQFLFCNLTDEIIERVIADRFDVDAHYGCLTEENIKRFHEAGLAVNCWTVDDKEKAEQLVKLGVDFITSNILE